MEFPRWLATARSYVGIREIVGVQNNPTIMKMAIRLGGWIASYYKDDEIPWCALFVNNCLAESGVKGTSSLASASFATWGRPMPTPTPGAVLVFAWDGGGHVGFYTGQRADGMLTVLGGNQVDAVSETLFYPRHLIATRWPTGEALPAGYNLNPEV